MKALKHINGIPFASRNPLTMHLHHAFTQKVNNLGSKPFCVTSNTEMMKKKDEKKRVEFLEIKFHLKKNIE
jgi:hypothetical protein